MNRKGVYFGPINFKHQAQFEPEQLGVPIGKVRKYLDVMTTSGPRTGVAADPAIVELIKIIAEKHPVALASGVTPENISEYINNIDLAIVATWISKDYWNLHPDKVLELSQQFAKYNSIKAQNS